MQQPGEVAVGIELGRAGDVAERVGAALADADAVEALGAFVGEECFDVFHRRLLRRIFAARMLGGGGEDGVDDRLVAGAAADVAGDGVDHRRAVGIGIAVEERLGGEDHAGRAEAALGGEAVGEGALQRVQRAVRRRALRASRPRRPRRAAAGTRQESVELAVDQHGAGAAGALPAADLGGGEAELVAEHVGEKRAGLDELAPVRRR